MELLKFEESYY